MLRKEFDRTGKGWNTLPFSKIPNYILSIPNENNDNNNEPIKALKNPLTENPGAIAPASINNNAFNTNENNPNVRKLIGKEINCKTGFTKAFIKAIIKQTIIAAKKLSTPIPGTAQAINTIARE